MTIQGPSKRNVNLSFWLSHIAIAVGAYMFFAVEGAQTVAGILVLAGSLCALWYCFAIGSFAKQLGRKAILWGGLSFLFAPLAMWITYIASFFVGPVPPKGDATAGLAS